MKINYILPKQWCVKVTKENQHTLSHWRFDDGRILGLDCYVGISKYGGHGHTFSKEIVWSDYEEISFEDFQKYVLDKFTEPEDSTPESYDYLIPLLNTII